MESVSLRVTEEGDMMHLTLLAKVEQSSFLNGPLEEEVYVCQPPGFEVTGHEDKVCRLKKALYGLKQAPQAWNRRIGCFLLQLDFNKGTIEHGVYVRATASDLIQPDIAYGVRLISRFMDHPRLSHLHAAKRILRYVKGTLDYRLLFSKRVYSNTLAMRPLQTYRCQQSTMVSDHAIVRTCEAILDSSLMQTILLDSAHSPDLDLPIALRKGTHSTRNPYPYYINLSYHKFSSVHCACLSSLSCVFIPNSPNEALAHPEWHQTMIDELCVLQSNGTWELTIKVGPDCQIDRFKARMVAKGYTKGESYLEVEFVIEPLPFPTHDVIESLSVPTQDVQVQVQEVMKLALVPKQVQLSKLEVSILENLIEDVTDDMSIALRKGKRSCIKYPISQIVCTDHLFVQHQSFIVAIDAIKTPTSVQKL
ncbi:hypothetical protein CR513_17186, partial [Mucuna pruriens]